MTDLPNQAERERLSHLVGDVLVLIRTLARESGDENIEALADAFHNLPREIYGWGQWDRKLTRSVIADYAEKFDNPGLLETFAACFDEDGGQD